MSRRQAPRGLLQRLRKTWNTWRLRQALAGAEADVDASLNDLSRWLSAEICAEPGSEHQRTCTAQVQLHRLGLAQAVTRARTLRATLRSSSHQGAHP